MYKPKYKISNKLLNHLSRISAAHNLITNVPLLARDLKDLADKKLVRMKGERKGVYYELNI